MDKQKNVLVKFQMIADKLRDVEEAIKELKLELKQSGVIVSKKDIQ